MEPTQTRALKFVNKRIAKVELAPNEDVYDITTSKNHNFFANNTLVHNCGEISMLAPPGVVEIDGILYEHLGDVCNLGSINLCQFWKMGESGWYFDLEQLGKTIATLVRSLDNLIDVSGYPLEKIKNSATLRRKIGCGFMGYGSLLMMMGLKYGSAEANEFTESLFDFYANTAYRASADLAEEKGAFPLYDGDKIFDVGYLKNGPLSAETIEIIRKKKLRNSQLLTAAPTGTTSILAGMVSGGCEPVFETEYVRWVIKNHRAADLLAGKQHPDWSKKEWFETSDFKIKMKNDEEVLVSSDGNLEINKDHGLRQKQVCEDFGWTWTKQNRTEEEIKQLKKRGVFTCAMDLTVDEHLKPFEIMSKYICNSLSKTINLKADYPMEEFDSLYRRLHKNGVRGVTTYREGTMTAVLETKKEADKSAREIKREQKDFYDHWKEHESGETITDDVQLPSEYEMTGYKLTSEGKKFYISCAFKDRSKTRPFAIFVHTNNRESEIHTYNALSHLTALARIEGIREDIIEDNAVKMAGQNNINKLARTLGLLLRHNVDVGLIVKTLDTLEDVPVSSFIFRIKKFLMKFVTELENGAVCPECGEKLIYREGCISCSGCSYSKC